MSANAHAPDSHDAHDAHGHGGADHVPHVLPLTHYFKTYGALLVLTVITVGASYVNLGTQVNLVLALGIATIKATVVALIFMHLYWDQKFFAIIFSSSVLFLAIFLAFTMFDTNARGVADPMEAEKPTDYKVPFAAGGMQSDARFRKAAAKEKLHAEEAAKKMVPTYRPSPGAAAAAPAAAGPAAGQPTAPEGVAPTPSGVTPTPQPSIPAPAGLAPGSVPPRGDEAKGAAPGLPPAPAPAPAPPH